MAAESGFEPEQNESESFVLPLHNSAKSTDLNIIAENTLNVKSFFEIFQKNQNLVFVAYITVFPKYRKIYILQDGKTSDRGL